MSKLARGRPGGPSGSGAGDDAMTETADLDALDLMAIIAAFAKQRGATKLNTHPGCWEAAVDERWRIAINAHPEAHAAADGWKVPMYSFAVFFNGWLWCVANATGGFVGHGEGASLDTFRAAIQAASEHAEGEGDP